MTSVDATDIERSAHAELGYLEEQLAALDEVRRDGHASDIVHFAHDGLCRAIEIETIVDAQTCDRASQLTDDYRKLLKSLVH